MTAVLKHNYPYNKYIYRVSPKKFPFLKVHSTRSTSPISMIPILVKSRKIEVFL